MGFRIERIFSSYIVFIFVIKIFDTKIVIRDQCAKLHVLNKFLEINKRPSVTRASELYTDLSEQLIFAFHPPFYDISPTPLRYVSICHLLNTAFYITLIFHTKPFSFLPPHQPCPWKHLICQRPPLVFIISLCMYSICLRCEKEMEKEKYISCPYDQYSHALAQRSYNKGRQIDHCSSEQNISQVNLLNALERR